MGGQCRRRFYQRSNSAVSRKKNGAATALLEPTPFERANAEIITLHDVPALRALACNGRQTAIDLEQTTREAMDCCRSSQEAAREAILRLHDAGELDASAANIAKLKALRL